MLFLNQLKVILQKQKREKKIEKNKDKIKKTKTKIKKKNQERFG